MIRAVRSSRKSRCIVWMVGLLVAVLALLVAGCGASPSPTPAPREPFSLRRESEDGAVVAWGGATAGYEPGAEAAFDLTIRNETEQDWSGRYCFQLLDGQSHRVIASLEQRAFSLEPGVGFSDTVSVALPEGLDPGAYGLALAVRRPGGPMVDLVAIQVGDTDEVRRATTQQDLDAALAACPPVEGATQLVELARTDLAQRLGVGLEEIDVAGVEPTEFPDASLGVPEPGKDYAQVVTSGYVIELMVGGESYRYHASGERVVAVPDDEAHAPSGKSLISLLE